MKRVQGKSILELLQEPDLYDLDELLNALIQVCNGLEYAHSHSIFHRDVKPENIMLGEFGEVYLLDWGIAVKRGETSPYGLVGTPAYLAPEMLSGDPQDIDERTDVYLLGATLHHILVGHPRHIGEDLKAVFDKVKHSAPFHYAADVPDQLAQLVNESCARNPSDRPQSAAEFRERLHQFHQHQQAHSLTKAAREDFEQLTTLVEQQSAERDLIHRHYNRCRFACDQALLIFPESTESNRLRQRMIEKMAAYYLSRQQPVAAQLLLDELDVIPPNLTNLLSQQIENQVSLEQDAELYRQHGWRLRQSSLLFRSTFGLGAFATCLIFGYNLFQIDDLDPNATLTPEDLLFQAIAMFVPLIPLLVLGRNRLLTNPDGRRAAIAVSGVVMVVILHRWVALQYNELPSSIIVVDLFILGVGIATTPPTIRYGRQLGALCILVGVVNHLFPVTFWLGSLLVAVSVGIAVIFDWKRNWNVN